MVASPDYDVLVIGAGFGGIYQLYACREELGLRSHLIDAHAGPGGTWWANRYPGAMSDTQSHLYRYSWDKKLLEEYPWPDHYSKQPEVLAYLEHVVDRYNLRKDMEFSTAMTESRWDEQAQIWKVQTSKGTTITARYLVTALGPLSAINWPNIPGRESFKGDMLHTGAWPAGHDLSGKRVAVIGCGSTGVQVITKIAPIVKELQCYQRSPQYTVPARDGPVPEEYRKQIVENWDKVWDKVRNSAFGFAFEESNESFFSVSEEERQRRFEEAWNKGGGFNFMFSTFNDLAISPEANEYAAQFIRNKIAQTVKDPEKARLLTPTEFHARRPVCDSGYYETFNNDHVSIVNARETPIVEITPTGIKTSDGKVREVDAIIFATGFSASDGNYNRARIIGKNGVSLKDRWASAPSSYLGISAPEFPNLLMILGPCCPFANIPPCIEAQVEFITKLLKHANGKTIETTEEAEESWKATCKLISSYLLFEKLDSWIFGANADRNPGPGGKKEKVVQFYLGGIAQYRAKLADIESKDFEGYQIK